MNVVKIVAVLIVALCFAAAGAAAQGTHDSLASVFTGNTDSTGADAKLPLDHSAGTDTLAFRSAARSSLHTSSLYAKPGIADMITDLPGAWEDWAVLTFRTENIPMYTGIGLLTAGMVVTDHQTYTPLRKFYHENPTYHHVAETFQFMGDGWFQFGLGAAFCAHGLVFNDAKSLSVASQTVEVILACGGVVQTLKHLTGRESPFVATSPTGIWNLFPNQVQYARHVPHYDAYPSGHVATAMATLTVITENYPDATWIKYIGYPTIGLIGVSMMGTGIHWLSDYPLSWALGYTFGKAVAHRHKPAPDGVTQRSVYDPDAEFTILNNGAPGIALTWNW